jgi:zinc resistance-associated protein
MKRVAATLGILLMVAFFAAPVFGYRGDRWGGWSGGFGSCGRGGGGYGNVPQNQGDELYELEQKFYDSTAKIRDEIWNKNRELEGLLNSASPDPKRIRGIQKEINDLKAKLDQKRLDFDLKARKLAPRDRYGRGFSGGYGRHMGGRRGDYGHGPGRWY